MDSQLFFIINLVAALFIIVWFLSGRKGNSNVSSLNLKKGDYFKNAEDGEPNVDAIKNLDLSYKKSYATQKDKDKFPKDKVAAAKSLNVLFMYNGHDWDAYEVLGLPAGCGIHLVTKRYQELIQNAEEGKLLFYQAAYDAILKKQ